MNYNSRDNIMSDLPECSEEVSDYVKDLVDYFEDKFSELSILLDINSVSDLENIETAKDLATKTKDELY